MQKRQFNIRISDECYQQLETLTKKSSTNICPTCGSETDIEFSKFKDMKPTGLATLLLEEAVQKLTKKDSQES